jgi:hypothetical protein
MLSASCEDLIQPLRYPASIDQTPISRKAAKSGALQIALHIDEASAAPVGLAAT